MPVARPSPNERTEPAGSKAAQTRRRILDFASEVFAERGFRGASLSEIAAAASMKSGSLYFHFASKDELIAEVLREAISRSIDHVRSAVDGLGDAASARERIAAAISAHIAALHDMSSYAMAVLRLVDEVSAEIRVSFRSRERQYTQYWNKLVQDAQAEGCFTGTQDARDIRKVLFGAMNACATGAGMRGGSAEQATLVLTLFGLRQP